MKNAISVSWLDIKRAIDKITNHLKSLTNETFVSVYGIPRGGLVPAVMLSHRLNIPLIIDPKIVRAHTISLTSRKIIIIDDISDTGNTLFEFTSIYGRHNAYIITIHEHPKTVFKPDFSVFPKGKNWLVYPWEKNIKEYDLITYDLITKSSTSPYKLG